MTIDTAAPSGPSLVRFATPHLEVETQPTSSLERTIRRELAQVNPAAPNEPSLVRFATPYLEVETQPTSSLERTIRRELAQVNHAARRQRNGGDQPSHRVA
ncbi:MAG: hypothetical protein ABSG95_15060 [Solirubrobacteraceae bacterium]|jgi:hypothetical protein